MPDAHEIETNSVNLDGTVLAYGPVRFVRAEWRGQPTPRLVVLRYAIEGRAGEAPLGVRLDLDKRAFLDEIADIGDLAPQVNGEIRGHAEDISDAVVKEWRASVLSRR